MATTRTLARANSRTRPLVATTAAMTTREEPPSDAGVVDAGVDTGVGPGGGDVVSKLSVVAMPGYT